MLSPPNIYTTYLTPIVDHVFKKVNTFVDTSSFWKLHFPYTSPNNMSTSRCTLSPWHTLSLGWTHYLHHSRSGPRGEKRKHHGREVSPLFRVVIVKILATLKKSLTFWTVTTRSRIPSLWGIYTTQVMPEESSESSSVSGLLGVISFNDNYSHYVWSQSSLYKWKSS